MLTISRSGLFVLIQIFMVLWLTILVNSRKEAERMRIEERKKYGRWDDAYKEALGEGKLEYYACMAAVKAVNGGSELLKIWDNTYDNAIKAGIRKYKAGKKATETVRKAAHGD